MLLPGIHAPLPESLFILHCMSSSYLRLLHHQPLLSQSSSLFMEISFISETCLNLCLSHYLKCLLPSFLPSLLSKFYPSSKGWLKSQYCTKPSLVFPDLGHSFLLSSSSCYSLWCWFCRLLHNVQVLHSALLQMCPMDHPVFIQFFFLTIS